MTYVVNWRYINKAELNYSKCQHLFGQSESEKNATTSQCIHQFISQMIRRYYFYENELIWNSTSHLDTLIVKSQDHFRSVSTPIPFPTLYIYVY